MARKKTQTEEPPKEEAPGDEPLVAAPDSEPADPPRHVEDRYKSSKSLSCLLTESEKKSKGDDFLQSVIRLEELNNLKANAAAQYTGEIKKAKATVACLSNLLNAGHEFRDVEIEVVKDFTTARMRVVRLDTYEIIEDRELVGLERQIPMRLQRPKDEAPAAPAAPEPEAASEEAPAPEAVAVEGEPAGGEDALAEGEEEPADGDEAALEEEASDDPDDDDDDAGFDDAPDEDDAPADDDDDDDEWSDEDDTPDEDDPVDTDDDDDAA